MAPPKTTASKPATKRKAPAKKPATPKAKTASKPKAAKPDPVPATPLTPEEELLASMDPRHVRFVESYLGSYNQTSAYRAAFDTKGDMSDNSCAANASRLLRTDKVARLMALRVRQAFDDMDGDIKTRALERLMGMAFGDPNELTEIRRECCRFCYGIDNEYQYKPSEWREKLDEYARDLAEATKNESKPPAEPKPAGGTGFDPRLEPNAECPECFGEGVERQVLKDTRHLSPAGRALYAGSKWTKDGLQILQHDQLKAFDMLTRVIKMLDDRPEAIINVVAAEVLDEIYTKAMQNAAEGKERLGARLGVPPPVRPGLTG
jgi:phage terminase small subunit